MKRIISILLLLLLMLSLAVPAYAMELNNPWVVDHAGLLDWKEIDELTAAI